MSSATMDQTTTRTLITGGNPEERFPIPEDGAWEFLPAPDLERVGLALIGSCPELAHVAGLDVAFVWKRKGGKKRGWCQRPSGLLKFYAKSDFVIWLAADHTFDLSMTRWEVEALLFHELSFADLETDKETGETKPVMRSLEIEAWVSELERYGPWSESLGRAKRAFAQMPLFTDAVHEAAKGLRDLADNAGVDIIMSSGDRSVLVGAGR